MNRHTTPRRRGFLAPVLTSLAIAIFVLTASSRIFGQGSTTSWRIVAWNNLGMHCMDADFGVFAILPPYNTIQAQVIDPAGRLVTDSTGLKVTYQSVADPAGSINTTSVGKTNFWQFVQALFGGAVPADAGFLGHNMPGAGNPPQDMAFDGALDWFIAEGIPITPYDDSGAKNYYPMMRVTASDAMGNPLASTSIVLPVSDEMDCSACHRSNSVEAARPAAGWVNKTNKQRDFRLNILRLHDDRQMGSPFYADALLVKGYNAQGLYATAMSGHPILCANCHKSEALAGSGIDGISPLTTAMHGLHAHVIDPENGLSLGTSDNRSACYRCHPGSETRCLRGVMGNAVASDGTMAIQCQNCHGSMAVVGAPTRTGWLQEPTCQNCHTGTAMMNSGAIRFTSAFDATGDWRVPADRAFATNDNVPAAGFSLYRFSAGHGGLQCEACHGSTHAEYPSSHGNDNVQSVALQGHVGTIGECRACHGTVPVTVAGGPHGMHPVGAAWVSQHGSAAEGNLTQCRRCHGADDRGTVLSHSFADRTFNTEFGTKRFFRGAQVGCYACHNGPRSETANLNRPPTATNITTAAQSESATPVTLLASDPDGDPLTLRVVSQPRNGTVRLSGSIATYYPYAGFAGTDTFTYAAWDGAIDSDLATVTMNVSGCSLTSNASLPGSAVAGIAVSFAATAAPSGCTGSISYDWDFGDGTKHSALQAGTHAYAAAGTFHWTVAASLGSVTSHTSGVIIVTRAPAPVITSVRAMANPFRIQVNGANFQARSAVFLDADTQPWPNVTHPSGERLVLKGTGLEARFPRGTPVTIRVVNPDGQSTSVVFTR